MNPNCGDVENLLDLLNNVWIGVVVVVAAAVPSFLAHRNSKTLAQVKEQVQNGHTQTNLRDDLDRALAAIEALANDIHGLRKDLALEQASRANQVDDLRGDIDRMRRR